MMRFRGILTCGKPKTIDHHLITAFIEHWRLETHTFHLSVGEVTITLQDVKVTLGLKVDGMPVTGLETYITHEYLGQLCFDIFGVNTSDIELKASGICVATLLNEIDELLTDELLPYRYLQRTHIYCLIMLGRLTTTSNRVPFFITTEVACILTFPSPGRERNYS